MTGRIMQFGTSRFLQAHADLFVHEARMNGQKIGPITVVKTTPGGDRTGRIAAFKRGHPYPVRIRGYEAGRVVDRTVDVASIAEAFTAESEWSDIVRTFAEETDIALSNVTESGYLLDSEDRGHDYSARKPPRSFPAKLLSLLVARYDAGGKPLLFLPTELVSNNGQTLSNIVMKLARNARLSDAFRSWLAQSIIFADTLVDRIVSEEIPPIGAVAEPYALWAIKSNGFEEPLHHSCVRIVDDLEPYEKLKLHILNLGHTVLVDQWMRQHGDAEETVGHILSRAATADYLASIYAEEVVPGFALHGMGEVAEHYVATTLERFNNPFLDHRLADIAQNHAIKVQNRLGNFISWVRLKESSFTATRLSSCL